MGECIGLDFGTTYSVVSHLKKGADGQLIPQPVDFGGEEKNVTAMETLVVVDRRGDTYVGYEAVPLMRRAKSVYKGFKMLLSCREEDRKELVRRGFADKTPEAVTNLFLSELFRKVKEADPGCREIDKVVVGVPYVWTQNGADSRKFEVADIVQKATGAKLVEFQSEPTLACAYYVQEINKQREKHFDGYILVIDYGGGTLDVTLCKAEEQNGKSQIKVCGSWGAGENTDGRIGSAGLAFMEEVADLLLAENQIVVKKKEEQEYQSFVKNIEIAIKNQSAFLRKCLNKERRYFTPGGERYNEEIDGISAYYKGEEYYVTYRTLVEAYDNSIRPVLTRVLAEAKADMDRLCIPYGDYEHGSFKIATIGGFCNFALTDKQIRSDTDWLQRRHPTLDTRYTELDEMMMPKNRELAIANGAALTANDIVEIKKQFPYTLCFYSETFQVNRRGERKAVPDVNEEFIMFREDEEYIPGKPVFLAVEDTDSSGRKVLRKLKVRGAGIPYIQRKKNKNVSDIKRPAAEMSLPSETEDDFYIAMAMERNENLTLYVYGQTAFDRLTSAEQENPLNEALLKKADFPNIDTLLGSFYRTW